MFGRASVERVPLGALMQEVGSLVRYVLDKVMYTHVQGCRA